MEYRKQIANLSGKINAMEESYAINLAFMRIIMMGSLLPLSDWVGYFNEDFRGCNLWCCPTVRGYGLNMFPQQDTGTQIAPHDLPLLIYSTNACYKNDLMVECYINGMAAFLEEFNWCIIWIILEQLFPELKCFFFYSYTYY